MFTTLNLAPCHGTNGGQVKRIKTSNPNIIGWQKGGGFLALVSSLFLISGLSIMSVPLSGVEVEGNMPEWALIPFGGLFTLRSWR